METYVNCGEGCRKPGLGSPSHDPYNDRCSDCALICCPCAFGLDIITIVLYPITCPLKFIYRKYCSKNKLNEQTNHDE